MDHPTSSNLEDSFERPHIPIDSDDSDESINLDNIETESLKSNSSLSIEDSEEGTSGSETGSVVSQMEILNDDASSVFVGADGTRWFDKFDTSTFEDFESFGPKINTIKCSECTKPLGK